MAIFLQLFLLIDVFVAGIVVAVAAQQAYLHLHSKRQQPIGPARQRIEPLPTIVKDRLVAESQARFQSAVNNSASLLEQDLDTTAALLDQLVKRLGTEIIGDELERYRTEVAQLRSQAQASARGIKDQLETRRKEIEQQLTDEIAAEKKHLLQHIDTKLADAVASFLLETLGHNIDLGAQEPYLKALLDEHKADFAKEVTDELRTSK